MSGAPGALTPVAYLKPVIVGGVEVSRATLHNEDEIGRKDIRVGDSVIVTRAGDVIPEVVRVIDPDRPGRSEPFTMPLNCPVCGEPVVRPPGEAIRRCVNISCPAQIKGTIEHFASKRAMDIDGLGTKLVEQLVDRGTMRDVSDLYFIGKETLAGMERMADKSAQNIIDAIEASKKRPFARFIYALGIRQVGEHVAGAPRRTFRLDRRPYGREMSIPLSPFPRSDPKPQTALRHFLVTRRTARPIERILSAGLVLEYEQQRQ